MLKRLQRKIIRINMTLASVVLLIALTLVCILSTKNARRDLLQGLSRAVQQYWPPDAVMNSLETPGDITLPLESHVAVLLENDGCWILLSEDGLSISHETLDKAVVKAAASEDHQGTLSQLKLAYAKRVTPNGTLLLFGTLSSVTATLWYTLLICAAIFIGGTAVLFFISLGMSYMAVRPIDKAWQQQKQFIADASHEFKTPLTVILANTHIISAHAEETVAQQDQWLHSTVEEAEQMRRLLDEMLTLARADDEHAAITLRPIDGSELIEEEILYLEPVAYEKNVPLEMELEKNLVWDTDPTLLRKLTVLLTDNAIKYSAPGKPVTIRLTGGKSICLSVHNDGPPIAPEDLPHLFERFYRSDKSRSTDGHGLGLAIARATTEKLKGKLSVVSNEKDGTIFTAEFKP